MTTYIALLRGINVGGHRMIKMTDLRDLFQSMGMANVQTYIQSGNVLFHSSTDAGALRDQIEQQILNRFGFPVTVVIRTVEELKRVIEDCPFDAGVLPDGQTLYVSFLTDKPSQDLLSRMLAYRDETDDFRVGGREVYILYRQSAHKSKLSNSFIEKRLGVSATSRNWQTTTRLLEISQALDVD